MPLLLEASERPMKTFDSSSCPLCTDWELRFSDNAKVFGRHLARHLQQIALEALPLAIDGLEVRNPGPVAELGGPVSGESSNEDKAANPQDESTPAITHGESSGMTLSQTAGSGLAAVVTEMLENKADVEARDANDQTPLGLAASEGHEAIVRLLLEKGAYVDTIDSMYGRTPLNWAVVNGHESVAWLLVDHGADINEALRTQGTSAGEIQNQGSRQALKVLFKRPEIVVPSASKAGILNERIGASYVDGQWFCQCGEAAKWYSSGRGESFGQRFLACAQFVPLACQFFVWEKDERLERNSYRRASPPSLHTIETQQVASGNADSSSSVKAKSSSSVHIGNNHGGKGIFDA